METQNSRSVTIKALDKTNMLILVDGKETLKITENQITDQGIFTSLEYSPYVTYTLDSKDETASSNAAYMELYNLYSDIIEKINAMNSKGEDESL